MTRFAVWLEAVDAGTAGTAHSYGSQELPPEEPQEEPLRLTWRGPARDREEARELACAAWEERYGPGGLARLSYVIEIGEEDAGYRVP